MSFEFERAGRKLFLVKQHPASQLSLAMCGTDQSPRKDFPRHAAKVQVINVDTAGKEVPLSSQEGI